MQLGASSKHLARNLNLVTHQREKLRRGNATLEISGRDGELAQISTRKIDAVLFEIDRDILPEIRELKSAANQIGKPLPLLIAICKQVQHQAPDWIG